MHNTPRFPFECVSWEGGGERERVVVMILFALHVWCVGEIMYVLWWGASVSVSEGDDGVVVVMIGCNVKTAM